ncbi:MAG: PAS domain S-box protein, partial [Actinomycetia bacterium]|nr:PAS domain S-box protein [Actinomycetes bacterium]
MKKKDRNEEPEDVGKVPGQKEPHFQQIANASPDAIININSSGTIIFWSKAAERIFRYSEKTILGRDVTTLIPERYKLAHQRGMTRFFKTGKGRFINETVELEARRQDGSEFPIELSLSAWRTDNEAFATGIIRDITERKQNEEDLEKSYRTQKVLNSLLHLSITDIPLDEQLENALDIILSVPFMQLTPKGGIFIAEEDSPELLLSASRNLPKTLLVMCKKVPFGECLCGRAAASGEIIFTNSVDRHHEHRYEGIVPHGHYVV